MNQELDFPVSTQMRIEEALAEVFQGEFESRKAPRICFFGPATISLPDSNSQLLSAFARDVSATGIGLVHLMPIDRGDVIVTLSLPSGRLVSLRTEILWCRNYDNGWYSSGGRFVHVLS
jgi:hypothetical protein